MKLTIPSPSFRRLAAALLLVIPFVAGCGDQSESTAQSATAKPALTVRLVAPEAAEWPAVLVANGNVIAWQEAVIGAEVANYRIAEVRVQVGDAVRRGDVLARIAGDTVASELAEAAAAAAEAEAAAAEAAGNAERARELRAKGFYSTQLNAQYQAAERMATARANAARARQRAAQLKMDKTAVLAPDDGIISARRATVGSLTQSGEELFRLIRGGRLEWRAEVPSADLLRVPVGTPAQLTGPNGGTVSGTVRAVAPSVDAQTRNGLIYVDLPPTDAVRAGMFARGEFELGRTPVLSLPQTAVVLREGFAYVFRLEGEDRVAQTKVELGRRLGERVEILGGLPAAARVVESGGGFLADGDVVRVVDGKTP